jgi:hypothetical protein
MSEATAIAADDPPSLTKGFGAFNFSAVVVGADLKAGTPDGKRLDKPGLVPGANFNY